MSFKDENFSQETLTLNLYGQNFDQNFSRLETPFNKL